MKGKPKTPDILLMIPMTVQINGLSFLVNWIDSKGMFADAESFAEHEQVMCKHKKTFTLDCLFIRFYLINHMLQQLKGYVNRYGHGLVIYWYGYVENLAVVDNIQFTDSFPTVWHWPTGELARTDAQPSFDTCNSCDSIEDWCAEQRSNRLDTSMRDI